nr:fructosamine kinase family protein [Pleionea sp. CnH1-48]
MNQSKIDWIESQLLEPVTGFSGVSGGCISQAYKVELESGKTVFVKTSEQSPADMFYCEAAGLKAINQTLPGFAPEVLAVDDGILALTFLPAISSHGGGAQKLGVKLAAMHAQTTSVFGFEADNYCGATRQVNTWCEDGFEFFAEHRLQFQARLAYDQKYLSREHIKWLEKLADRLPSLLPEQPPVLLHGDLWSGNYLCSENEVWLIDPACYYGWAEADMAMTTLFGGFDESFYRAYEEHGQIASDWRSRCSIYNLYHLLNHLNLFGESYLSSVVSILRRYG